LPEPAIEAVLDSSAVLAVIFREPGADVVKPWIDRSVMSSINVAEVMRRLARAGMDPQGIASSWAILNARSVAFDTGDALQLAAVFPDCAELSFGGCACIALAKKLGVPAITADRVWGTTRSGVPIRQIR
jgi:PIN domain nuclease of toxin-antitoxin system